MLATKFISKVRRFYYNLIAKSITYSKIRWTLTLCLAALYAQRSYGMSYTIITYLIGFYLLQLALNYFTPKGIDMQESESQSQQETAIFLQSQLLSPSEKPLVSSMSQFQIWERVTFAFTLGMVCTYFKMFQIDVFWPLLVVYFFILVCYTIHKIVKKMEKYRYKIDDFTKKAVIF